MEVTGYNTVSTDSIAVTTNKYLKDIESWDERDLPCYKKKVNERMFNGYTAIVPGAIVAYIFYFLFIAIGFSIITSLYEILAEMPNLQWIVIALSYLAVFFIVFAYAKKSMVNFVDSCHGEIGHKGQPFRKRLIFNLVFSIILAVLASGAVIYLGGFPSTVTGLKIVDNFVYLSAIIAPFAYFLGSLVVLNSLTECPVCGRLNTVYKLKTSKDFGERKDGSHDEHEYKSERVGTKTTTTYYTDGSKDVRSEGIYQSVRYTKKYDDYSNLAKYTYLCHECSYVEETVEEKKWKILKSKYRG